MLKEGHKFISSNYNCQMSPSQNKVSTPNSCSPGERLQSGAFSEMRCKREKQKPCAFVPDISSLLSRKASVARTEVWVNVGRPQRDVVHFPLSFTRELSNDDNSENDT